MGLEKQEFRTQLMPSQRMSKVSFVKLKNPLNFERIRAHQEADFEMEMK